MKIHTIALLATMALLAAVVSAPAFAEDFTHSTPGIGGYDPVAYFTEGKPVRGNGYHVSEFQGVTYAFSNKANQKQFEANPEKYLPAYGGYCAYGVAVGKKFVANPEVWKVLDGKLYLNLDTDIQQTWEKDVSGNVKKADTNWDKIKDKAPSDL